jgi:condensin-2 complex subunit H2
MDFEALCRAHIKSFAKGAEKYAAETNLTKRVGEWQSKLAPILEEEERRPEFNIHEYGHLVIDIMSREVQKKKDSSKNKNVVSFQHVTKNCEHYEVCRLFLASLNLTSAGNVALASRSGPDSLDFKLLNTRVDHPMENYIAPSAAVL